MTKLNQVVNEAKTLAKSYRAVLSVVDKLEEIGDLEQAHAQAIETFRTVKQDITTSMASYNEAQNRLQIAYDELQDTKGMAADILAKAHNDANQLLEAASYEVEQSSKKSQQLIEDAKVEMETFYRSMREQSEGHRKRMKKNDIEYKEVDQRLIALNEELTRLKKKFE